MVQINWSETASTDLKEIYDYISLDSKLYAKRQVVKLKEKTFLIRKSIHIGHPVPELNSHKLRQLIEGKYRIIYKIINDNNVTIVTVHHSSRDFLNREIEF